MQIEVSELEGLVADDALAVRKNVERPLVIGLFPDAGLAIIGEKNLWVHQGVRGLVGDTHPWRREETGAWMLFSLIDVERELLFFLR